MPLSECLKILEKNDGNFTPFVYNSNRQIEPPNINQIFCFIKNSKIMPFSQFLHLITDKDDAEDKVLKFAKYAGPVLKYIALEI